ncbi:hypothetical protein JCM8547_001658 [Rhodosporidiobolus lusitaniae]
MSAPPPVPSDLKPIAPYLARAHELATAEPIISYWCTYHALQQAMSIGSQEPESQAFLFGLMDKLEAIKAENATNEAFSEDTVASAYVENFGLKLFSQADNEDRKGKATRLTARKFLAAANFLEVLTIFGEQSAENRDKMKYGKWKAADIAKAFREGRTPTPGPAGGLSAEEEAAPETSRVTADEAKELSREFAALEAEAKREEAETPGSSAPASAGEAGGGDEGEVEDYPFPQQPITLPSVPPSAPDFSSSSSPSVATDAPPDFIDSEPEQDEAEDSSRSHAQTPTVPSFLDTPVDSSTRPSSTVPTVPETHQTSTLHPPHTHLPSEPPAFPSAVFPPPAASSAPPLPPALPSQPQLQAFAPPPPTAPVAVDANESYDVATVAKVQKHAKWAISALDYEDWETARRELRSALRMLGG